MISIRRSKERGHFDHGWLNTYHTFSFDQYYDPRYMGFRSLRVINEDFVAAGRGFPKHGHRDMEIITYSLEVALKHEDSMGNGSVIRPGDVQRMSAGTGISHSEYNASKTEPVHFLQIWIIPRETGLKPGYEQRSFDLKAKRGSWVLVVSPDARDGSLKIHQDAELYLAGFSKGQTLNHRLEPGRQAWLQVTRGAATLNGTSLAAGDGAAVSKEELLQIESPADSEILLFDLR
jgi:redox-sensitive bicupin YhaK (pirin superfamily)